jgi:hypothetical protein
MFDHSDETFFDDDLLGAIKEAESEVLPMGEHRFKLCSVTPETVQNKDGVPIKFLVLRGHYANDGEPLTVRFALLQNNGEPNRFAIRDLGRGFIEAGIKRSMPDICQMTTEQFPVVMLKVYEDKRMDSDNKEKVWIKKQITKCEDQTSAAPVAVAPKPAANPQPQEAVHDDDSTPF